MCKAETLTTAFDHVRDRTLAPNLGRSFYILATATKHVRIFRLKLESRELTSSGGPTKSEIHIVTRLDNHSPRVWQVSLNLTETILTSPGDDSCVRSRKANYMAD